MKEIFDKLLSKERFKVVQDLVDMKEEAVPIILLILNGQAKNNYGYSFSDFIDPCRTAMIAVQELYKNGIVIDDIESLLIKMCNHEAYMVIEEACRTFSIIGWKSDEVTEKICELLDCQFSVAAEAVFALEKAGKINSEQLKKKLHLSCQAKKMFEFFKNKNV